MGLFASCSSEQMMKIKITNKTENNIITVITHKGTRYVIPGDVDFIPKENYVKLEISDIDYNYDAFFGCFDESKYKWKLINPKSKILENKLDKSKYNFSNRDVYDKAEITKFQENTNCFEFSLVGMKTLGESEVEIQKSFINIKQE